MAFLPLNIKNNPFHKETTILITLSNLKKNQANRSQK